MAQGHLQAAAWPSMAPCSIAASGSRNLLGRLPGKSFAVTDSKVSVWTWSRVVREDSDLGWALSAW